MIAVHRPLQKQTGLRNLAVGGGVYANVRLNRALLETTPPKRSSSFRRWATRDCRSAVVWIISCSSAAPKWQRNVAARSCWVATTAPIRRRLPNFGCRVRPCSGGGGRDALVGPGEAVGIHDGRMEFGPRALGARSILASPVRREINDSLNARLSRSDFMPFAPVVLSEYAGPAVRHPLRQCARRPFHDHHLRRSGGVARPHSRRRPHRRIGAAANRRSRAANALSPHSGSLLPRSGIPVLVNTSFNVHEEPIIDTPEQALAALIDGRSTAS